TEGSRLWAVAARAATDVWAVGDYYTGSWFQTLTEHWDGSTWSIVPSPSQATGDYSLGGVTALAANDVWAAGYDNINLGTDQTLTEHWNGSSWSIVPSPNQGTLTNSLEGVAAVSANDVWTAGYDYLSYASGGTTQTLTQHYNDSCIAPTSTATPPPPATAT